MIDMYVNKNREIAFRVIEGQAVILTPANGMLHTLSLVATRIFELANGKRKISEICNGIVEEFDAEEDVVARDARRFIEDMLHKKILVLSESKSA